MIELGDLCDLDQGLGEPGRDAICVTCGMRRGEHALFGGDRCPLFAAGEHGWWLCGWKDSRFAPAGPSMPRARCVCRNCAEPLSAHSGLKCRTEEGRHFVPGARFR